MNIKYTALTESQVKNLGEAIGKSGTVTKLSASSCGTTDSGAQAFAAGIEKRLKLQTLDLTSNKSLTQAPKL